MDILVIFGVFVAVVLILVGLYMVLQPKAVAREIAPIVDEPEEQTLSQIELGLEPVAEQIRIEPVISANDFITQTINQHSSNGSVYASPSVHQTVDSIEFEHLSPVHTDMAVPILVEDEPKISGLGLLPVDDQDHHGLDALLDDLAEATALSDMARQGDIVSDLNQVYETLSPHSDRHINLSAVPDVIGTTQLAAWEGESALINEHLAEHTRSEEDSILVQAEQIVALHLVPKSGRPLEGRFVLQLLRKYGLRFGEMDLFHRFEETSGDGAMMFSVLKYTQEGPAGFDLDTMEQEQFEGLSFFLALPGIKPLQGFDMMMSTAQRLGQECYANLLDDEMNLLSEQLKSHYRHRVLDFRSSN